MLMPTEFHCYLVQKTQWNAVFHPAKLASGANYPVGWVQMPHSVRGVGGAEGAWGKGKNGVRLGGGGDEAVSPRCAVSTLVLLWPQGQSFYRAETCPHLDLPSCSFFFKIIVICSFTCLNALLGPISSWEPPTTTTDVPWWPEKKYINIYIK